VTELERTTRELAKLRAAHLRVQAQLSDARAKLTEHRYDSSGQYLSYERFLNDPKLAPSMSEFVLHTPGALGGFMTRMQKASSHVTYGGSGMMAM